jgi:hypothetical protein
VRRDTRGHALVLTGLVSGGGSAWWCSAQGSRNERHGEVVRLPETPEHTFCDTAYYKSWVEGDLYDGIPVDRLPIDAVDVPDPAHRRRSDRYRGAVDIEPEHAVEAVFDPRRLVARDPKSRTGEAIRVVGYSAGMDRILVVVLVPDGHPPSGLWHVCTAWPAEGNLRRLYGGKESEDG